LRYGVGVLAMDALSASPERVDLAALTAASGRRGARLDEAPARWLGHRVAALLAEAHANLDTEGNIAPIVHGRLAPERVLIDADGDVMLVDGAGETTATEPSDANRADASRPTPRTDVHALGVILGPLLPSWGDPDLDEALAIAADPVPSRRRVTCVELEALFARGLDLDAARRALGDSVRACLEEADLPAEGSRPIPVPLRIGLALVTAALVFASGVLLVEHLLR
jgi:hypothetical protein